MEASKMDKNQSKLLNGTKFYLNSETMYNPLSRRIPIPRPRPRINLLNLPIPINSSPSRSMRLGSTCSAFRPARVAYTRHDGLCGDAGIAARCGGWFVHAWAHAPYDFGALDAAFADVVAHFSWLEVWERWGEEEGERRA